MRYVVRISGPAQQDLDQQIDFLLSEGVSLERILQWVSRVSAAVGSLAEMPERCSRIPEPLITDVPIHHLLMGQHRIVFGIDGVSNVVTVYRVFHGARRLEPDDV